MAKNEVAEVKVGGSSISVNIDDIPDIVGRNLNDISALSKDVEKADDSAKKAMEVVDSMQHYENKKFLFIDYTSGNTEEIIKRAQEAIEQLAKAQQVSVNAQKKAFEFQKKLSDASTYLFGLGCVNMAANRSVVRELEAKWKNASKEELSELAKQEILSVIRQLKAQEDNLKKQEFLKAKLKELSAQLDKETAFAKELSGRIDRLGSESDEQNKKLSDIYTALSEKERIDTEQTKRIKEIDALLENKDLVDEKQENAISANKSAIERNAESIKVLFEYTKQKDILDSAQSQEIERLRMTAGSKKLSIVTLIVSAMAILSSGIAIVLQTAL